MKFDIIVGNPPFQQIESKNTLYPKFHNLALNIVKLGGSIALITPQAITNGFVEGGNCDKIKLTPSELITIDYTAGKHFVGVDSSFLWYMAKKSERQKVSLNNSTVTLRTSQEKSLTTQIRTLPFLGEDTGSAAVSILNKAFSFLANPYQGSTSDAGKRLEGTTPTPAVRTINADGTLDMKTIKGLPVNCKVYGGPKLMVGILGKKAAIVSEPHVVPTTDHLLFSVKTSSVDEAKILKSLLSSKLCTLFSVVSGDKRSPYMNFLRHFKGVSLAQSWTDNMLYKHFDLSDDEIKYIEEY